jgi:TonB-dependent SusC/RagA subfamily outer membrane receptor
MYRSLVSLLVSCTTVLAIAGSTAAAQTGVLSGAIFDQTNKTGLAGVTVKIPGTELYATTGRDGRFVIAGVPAGTRMIEAVRTGYEPYLLSRLRVVENDTSFVYLALAVEAVEVAPGIPVRTTTSLGPISPNAPLIIVDGVIMISGSMPDIPPDEIESVEVVRGAAGVELFGQRAANGVIVVKTKR